MADVLPPRPLTADDDRTAFDCGRPSMNAWFLRHSLANHESGASRVNVLTTDDGRVVGYVTLSAAQIQRAFLAKSQQRNRPDPIPVTLLGQLAVDTTFHGQGHARSLLLFAMKTALAVSESIGSLGVITHPIDDGVRQFYAKHGFADLPFDPHRAMMVRMADIRASFSDTTR